MEKKERILIIDDDESTCNSLSFIFRRKGYEIETAGTGGEAIKKAKAKFFNVALVDIKLPDMEGVELLTPLNEMHPIMVIIMVTAHASLESAVRALNEGASFYITKPLNMDEVLSTIREALEKQRLVMENRRLLQEIQHELDERKRAEKELRRHRDHLEEMVQERTAELIKVNEGLETEIAERKRVEEALRKSEEKYRTLFESAQEGIVVSGPDSKILSVNSAAAAMFGYEKPEEMKGLSAVELYQNPEQRQRLFTELMEKGYVRDYELLLKNRDGTPVDIMGSATIHRDEKGNILRTEGIFADITQRKKVEEQIKASLAEKEVLLKEIHHRVKNNLQTISSLLNLQSGYIEDKRALEVFKNSQERVRAMALIHEKLYQSRDLSKIDFAEYIQSLIKHLFDSCSLKEDQVLLNVEVEYLLLDIGSAIPLGLIINELVSNSLKHAFLDNRKGELHVYLGKSEHEKNEYDYTLIVRDNGVGYPDHLNFLDSGGLGMLLVNTLVKQLHGVIDLEKENGTTFTIKFKKLKEKDRI